MTETITEKDHGIKTTNRTLRKKSINQTNKQNLRNRQKER